VHLERQRRSGRTQRRHQRAHALGREQPAGVLEVQDVDVCARGDRSRAGGVVAVRVHRADAVHEADEHFLRLLLLRDARDTQRGLDVVHRLRNPDPPDPVSDHAAQREPHHVERRALPRHESHSRRDEPERRVGHQVAHDADALPRVLGVRPHGHRHVRAAREVDRAKADSIP